MKQSEKHEKSLSYILDSAIEEFAQSKSNEISINRLCNKYEISKGKLYHYFSSKEELYFACCEYSLRRLTADISEFTVLPQLGIEENFHRYYERRIDYWKDHVDEFALFYYAVLKFNMENDHRLSERLFIHKEIRTRKWKEIFFKSSGSLNITDDDLHEILKTLYDNLFIHHMKKYVNALKSNDGETAQFYKNNLLELNDKVIHVMLHGLLSIK